MYDTDPTVPTTQLLADLAEASMNGMNGKSHIVALPLGRLAIKLSREAEHLAKSVNRKTQQLIVLTRWLIGLTVIIIVIEVHHYLKELGWAAY